MYILNKGKCFMTTNRRKSDSNKSLIEQTMDYKNAIAKEKLRRLTLQNDNQAFDLSKKQETVCYRSVAMNEFEKAISSIYAQIKNASEQLTALLRLNTSQSDLLHDYMENILEDLSHIDIELSSTIEFDASNYFIGAARKKQMLNQK